jgi:hypothetical protein
MFKGLVAKKEYLFVAAMLFVCLACYQLSFKRTLIAWQLNKQLKVRLAQESDLANAPGYSARKSANLDQVLERYRADTTNFRSITISQIAAVAAAQQVKLAGVPVEEPADTAQQFRIQKLDFEGDFFSLMKVFQQLGRGRETGVIRSAAIRSKKNNAGEKEQKLMMELYFETNK